jgi:hypothetical protein
MTIQRQFQPDPAVMEDLVQVLYELLMDTPPKSPQATNPGDVRIDLLFHAT